LLLKKVIKGSFIYLLSDVVEPQDALLKTGAKL